MGNRTIEAIIGKLHRISAFLVQIVNDAMYDETARRAFANNAFDGALTFLGILLGNVVLNDFYPVTVIYIGLSTCLAIGMSGAFGRFLSERAERRALLRKLEKDLLTNLGDTSIEREGREKTIIISLIDGLSPALAAVIPLSPFFLAHASVIPVNASIVASFVLVFIVLFGLGMFLGKTSEESFLLYGGVTVAVGLVTSLIILSVSIAFR